jgi:succinate dehydrogenase/fumarate reductase-like Fe-S protein
VPSYYISLSDFKVVVEKFLETSLVYAPISSFDRVYFEKIGKDLIDKIVYDTARPVESPKSFFYPVKETAAKYFESEARHERPSIVIVGVKACDATALKAFDRVLLEGDFIDPSYKAKRDSSFIFGTDCSSIWPTCFCTKVGLKPYPEGSVDINLVRAQKGFVVEIQSQKGQDFYDKHPYYFRKATIEEMSDLRQSRDNVVSMLSRMNAVFDYKLPIHEIIKGALDVKEWRKITKFCIECGACNMSCPTCTCFMLFDKPSGGNYERARLWDACLKGGYAKVAGGASSRPILSERYNNRIQCKFDYSFDRINMYTCTGCGRCIECCPAKIDMRQAIKDLEGALALSAKLE